MLVLTRSVGQTIQIGDDIEITLIEIRRNPQTLADQLRIGIAAPKDVAVWRGEIIRRNGPQPAHTQPDPKE